MSAQAEELTAGLTVEDLWPYDCTDYMGTKARNAVLREGITTAAQLAARTDGELPGVRNLGPNVLAEIRRALAGYGLETAAAPQPAVSRVRRARSVPVGARRREGGSRHVAEELGIPCHRLGHWVRRGYLRPERGGAGPGFHCRWPEAEVEIARRMSRLVATGIDVARAAVFARDDWPRGEIAPGIRIEVDA